MFRGAIFDMDGVLVNNMQVHLAAFSEIARRYDVDFETDKVFSLSGMGNREFFGALFPAEIIERVGLDNLASEKEALYREIYSPKLAATQGLISFLDDLSAHNIKMAVGTSACQTNLDFVLDGLGIRHYFSALVTSDMVRQAKPAPDIYLLALKMLSLPASDCLVFEDAIAGIQAAKSAGVKVIALATSMPEATLQVTPNVALTVRDFSGLTSDSLKVLL